MSRPLRLEFPHAVYHVTGRGNARQRITRSDADRERFVAVLGQAVERYGWLCHAYCLMNNHYHLVVETPKSNLSLGMRHINGVYTQAFNRANRRVGHLFQGRFKSILIEKDTHLLEVCRYVVLNPVRARTVSHPRDWRWSSYRATAGESAAPEWLTVEWVHGQFGRRMKDVQRLYREFVAEGRETRESPWDLVQGQIYLGSEAFIAKHQPNRLIREIPREQTQAHRPALAALFGPHANRSRALVTAYRKHGYTLGAIADHLGVHYSTISRQLAEAEVEFGLRKA